MGAASKVLQSLMKTGKLDSESECLVFHGICCQLGCGKVKCICLEDE